MKHSQYLMLQQHIDRLIDNMNTLFNMSCLHVVELVGDDKSLELRHHWISETAKENYDRMQDELKYFLKAQLDLMDKENK